MDNTNQFGYINNGVPNYQIPYTQNPYVAQQPPVIQRQCENWYYVCPEDGHAVRYMDGSTKYHIVSLNPPIACQNYTIQTCPPVENYTYREEHNFQQQYAMKQLELQLLETQLRGEAVKKLPPYQLVLHNDAATSTTDLSYFTQSWRNNYSNMVKVNALAQYNIKYSPERMQVDPNTIDCLKLIQDNSLIKDNGKRPLKVQFNDNVTIFYTNEKSNCSLLDSDDEEINSQENNCSCEMITDSIPHDCKTNETHSTG